MEHIELPDGWRWTTVGDIASAINSGFPSGSHNQDGDGIPHLRPMNVSSDGTIDLSVTKYVPDNGKTHDRLKANDVLFNNTNSPILLGKTAAIKRDTDWAYSNHMTRIRPKADQAIGDWVAMCLHFLFRTGFFMQNCRNHVNQASINSSFLADEVWIPLPSLSEQQRIIEIIETQFTRLDAAVMALKRVQANLRRYRAAVLKAACEGRLLPTEAELAQAEGRTYEPAAALLKRILAERRAQWQAEHPGKQYKEPAGPDVSALPKLPEGWCWATVEQLSSHRRYSLAIGPFGSSLKVSDYCVSGVPLIFVRNIRAAKFSDLDDHFVSQEKAKELKAHTVTGGDILITKMGEPPGDACMYPLAATHGAIITADCIKLALCDECVGHTKLFVHYLNAAPVRDQVNHITQGVAQKKVSLERYRTIAVPLPPLLEQDRIANAIETLLSAKDVLVDDVAANRKRAERLRQSILANAFTGHLLSHPQDDVMKQLHFRF